VLFRYLVAHKDGRTERGTLSANSEERATQVLCDRGLLPIRVARVGRRQPKRREMRSEHQAIGLRVLANLLDTGIPLSRALGAMEELDLVAWRDILPGLREAIREGRSLGQSLRAAVPAPSELVIGIVQAGEQGSNLSDAVGRAALLMEESVETQASIRNALAYPVMLAVVGTGSVILLGTVVLPRFSAILDGLGQTLPPAARTLLATSAMLREGWPWLIVVALAAAVGWRGWQATPGARVRTDRWLLSLPLIGAIRHATASARACASLAALLRSGVPIGTALSTAANATGDAAVSDRMLRAHRAVTQGESLGRALAQHRAFSATATRLIRAGEQSGEVTRMLEHAARVDGSEALRRTRGLVRLLEPALIVSFGGLVALVAGALFQALYGVKPV